MGPFYDHQVGRFEAPRPDDGETYRAWVRRARAETMAQMSGALLRRLARALARLVRGAPWRPRRAGHRTPRLTGGCG